jgi:hypothetical protein
MSNDSGNLSHRQTQKARVQCKQELLIKWLQEFYNQPGRIDEILPVLTDKSDVSLRLIDWFVTNYSKKHNVSYLLNGRQFAVYFYYKRELKAYSKRLFDPFCRRERISFMVYGQPPLDETTVGQLNFFRWAIETGVLDYVVKHAAAIDADMKSSFKEHYSKEPDSKTPTGRRKRKEMSHSALTTVSLQPVSTMVSFD